MKLAGPSRMLITICLLAATRAIAASPWEAPAANLAQKIEAVLGASQAKLMVRNQSSIAEQDLAVIRKLLEDGLMARGVVLAGDESANAIRITLSENLRTRVWVAEIVQGNESKTVLVLAGPVVAEAPLSRTRILLQATPLFSVPGNASQESGALSTLPVLAVGGDDSGVVVLQAD